MAWDGCLHSTTGEDIVRKFVWDSRVTLPTDDLAARCVTTSEYLLFIVVTDGLLAGLHRP
jgi:hypothetical protein